MAEGFKDFTMQNKDKLIIAVAGSSGSGKSSFINSFCGLSQKDERAPVGVKEITKEIRSYTCTGNDKFVLFDLPGVGTAKFQKESYLEDIEFEKFHFFIIISSSRFTADDVWIGEMAKKHRKKCFYVRTKLDIDIIDDRYNQGDDFNEAATIENVRQEARKCLSEANVDAPIYLITTRRRHSFDFTSLEHDVNESAEENAMQDILQSFTDIFSENTTDVYDAISEKDQSLIVTVYKDKGATGLKDVIMQNKDTWTSQPLKIAVTGNSGSGKSSFINAFCGLSAKGKRAPVGVTETTNEIRSYTCTGNDRFILFDLPGVGTTKYPKESYLEDIEFEKFHFFIIISSSRFTENDAWLGTTIRKHRKQCFFVRTKIDVDISNESYDKDDDFNEAETIEQIRKEARKCLKEANVDIPVYLISTRLKKEKTFEFSSLKNAVNESAMELKRTALLVRFQSLAESVIDEKIELLKKGVGRVAMASAIAGAVPLPVVSIGVDAAVILSKVNLYRRKLFLDEISLPGVHDTYSINIDELELACRKIQVTEYGIPAAVTVNALGFLGKLVVPVLGSMAASSMCHEDMEMKLGTFLQDLKEDALKIITEITERMI